MSNSKSAFGFLVFLLLFSGLSFPCLASESSVAPPASEPSLESRRVIELYKKGNEAVRRQDWLHGEQYLLEALKLAPQISAVHHSLGLLYASLKEWDSAQTYLEQAIEISPGQYETLYALAKVYAKSGKKEKAEELFEKALTIHSTELRLYHDWASLYYDEGLWEQAIEVLEQGRKAMPGSVHTLTLLGVCAIKSNRPDVVLSVITELRSLGEVVKARNLEATLIQKNIKEKNQAAR